MNLSPPCVSKEVSNGFGFFSTLEIIGAGFCVKVVTGVDVFEWYGLLRSGVR